MKRFNWQIWAGFLVSLVAFVIYPLVLLKANINFHWASLLLFVIATVLMIFGVKRAFAADRPHPVRSRIAGGVLATLSFLVLGSFVFTFFIMARWLPASHGAPQVGQKAPDFILADTSGRQVSLSELLSSPLDVTSGSAGVPPANEREARIVPKGVLLIFYRGYW